MKGDGKGKKKITLSGGKRADASKSGEVDGIPKNGFLNDKTDADGIPKNGFLNDKTDIESIRKNAFSENGQGILNSQVGVSAFENGIKGIQDKGFLNAENDIENIPKSGFLNAENDIENIPKNGFLNAENDIENIPKNGFLNAENNIESIPKSGFLSEKNDGHGIQKSGFFQSGKEIPNTRGGSGGGQNAAKKPKKDLSKIGKRASYAAAAIGIFSLLSIVFFVLANGLPYMNASLLFGKFEYGGDPSIASSVVSTGMLVLLSSVIAFPIGIGAAIYLAEYTAKGGVFVRIIRLTVDTLGGIPSIVYGLFGMVFFCDLLGLGTSVLAGCLTVSLMIIPTTVRGTEEALLAVPDSLREGAYALGDSRIGTIFKVVIPSALPGIFAAVLLGIGRMAAESAPVLFTMGASLKPMPTGYKSSGTTLAVALYALSREGLHVNEAYACACILILIVLTLNVISTLLVSKLQKKLAGITAKKLKA
ncbi:MAG: phosphate ABC transporter permease PstA [Clostridiales bacterium]|nr:phosphate ABC transporter permease PstA [Clostridiales bacterium]